MNESTNHATQWRSQGVASPIVKEIRPRPRDLGEFQKFYQLWSRPVLAFCFLVCGDQAKAECLTEQTFAWYFRRADRVALRRSSSVPVGLLRSAADLARTHGSRRPGADSGRLDQALRELPFKERAGFIMVSVLRVEPSAAAVALRLSTNPLADCWIRAALRLHGLWLGSGESPEMQSAA